MKAMLRFSLIFVICVWASHAQYLGRTVRTYVPTPAEPCFGSPGGYSSSGSGSDDLSSLLSLARLIDSNQNQNVQPCGCPKSDINTEDIIHKLIDALLYATTNNNGGKNIGSGSTTSSVATSASYASTGGQTQVNQGQGVVPGLLEGLLGSGGKSDSTNNDGLVISLLQSLLGGGSNKGVVPGLLSGLLGASGSNKGVVPNLLGDLVGSAPGGGDGAVTNLLGGLLGGS